MQNKEPKQNPTAEIIAAIPRELWLTLIGLLLAFGITAIVFHFSALPRFVDSVLWWIGVVLDGGLVVIALKISMGLYRNYHEVLLTSTQRQLSRKKVHKLILENELLATRIRERDHYPLFAKEALMAGQNVELEGLKISNYLSNLHTILPGENRANTPTLLLPSACEMIAIARRQDCTKDNLFLACSDGGDIMTSISRYVHCANDGSTGTGKTENGRGQLVQFLKAGISCILLNPHFSLTTKKGDDWRPIAWSIAQQQRHDNGLPSIAIDFDHISSWLEWAATSEIDSRFEMMRRGDFSYQPLYLFIDEWPSIVSNDKLAPDYLRTILQRGRAVEVNVFVNSQGFLAQDTDLKGSARENFDTTFFLGGSTYSGAKLLDMKETDLKDAIATLSAPLGKGVAFMRNNSEMTQAQCVRLPLVTNEYVYYMLGHHDGYTLAERIIVDRGTKEQSVVQADHDQVKRAQTQLEHEGRVPSLRAIANITGFGKDKVARILKEV